MQSNYYNQYNPNCFPQQVPNAVNINIISPQAYGSANGVTNPVNNTTGYYPLYGTNMQPNVPLYPQNYNNLVHPYNIQNSAVAQMPYPNTQNNMAQNTALIQKTPNEDTTKTDTENKEEKVKTKKVVPLTDDYIKSLENYMNNDNPKIRLIGAKEVMERFKEDENRKDNPSLMPLLNKALQDTSPSVRFLALTTLQLEYALGNDETVNILKQIQATNKDKIGEDAILASEILLKMSAAQREDVPMTAGEIEKANKANAKKDNKEGSA